MTTRITLQPAFILHTRPFQDTSLLIDLFTLDHGRITLIGKGARSPRSKIRGILQPFIPLLVSWSGKSELPILSKVETNGNNIFSLPGNILASGFYLNELLMRLLQKRDPHPEIFHAYSQAVGILPAAKPATIAPILRIFEKNLITHLGYGLQFNIDHLGINIESASKYMFKFGTGFVKLSNKATIEATSVSGATITALEQEKFLSSEQLHEAKTLLQLVLSQLLGNRPIKSRELWFNE